MPERDLFKGQPRLRTRSPLFLGMVALVVSFGLSGLSHGFARPERPPTSPSPSRQVVQIDADNPDLPLLPGCPEGPPMPLPPVLNPRVAPKTHGPTRLMTGLPEGRGKYQGMILVPAGSFEMGSPVGEGRPDEQPSHKVFLKEFYIAKNVVTVKEFCEFLSRQGLQARDGFPRVGLDHPDCPVTRTGRTFKPKPGFADKPLVCVSWYGAAEYAEWAGGRLPTSAEWEKTALLTTPTAPEDSLAMVHVGIGTTPSAVRGSSGIRDMMGTVWQWCSDWYAKDYYAQSQPRNPTGPALGQEKDIRGGSLVSPECSKRIRNRHKAAPRGYYRTVGFRIVKD